MALTAGSYLVNLVGFLTAFAAIFYVYMKWSFQYWKRRGVPYWEPKIPFGNFMNPFRRTVNEGKQVTQMYLQAKANGWKYFGLYHLSIPNLVVLDLDMLKHILTKDFAVFADRGTYTNEKDDPLSGHLFSVGGPKWRNLRTKLSPTFTSGKMKMMFQTLADTGLILEKFLTENISSTEPVDIKDVLGRYSTDIIGSCAFGIECNSFKEPNSPFRVFGKRVFVETKLEGLRNAFCQSFPDLSRTLGLGIIQKDVSQFYMKMTKDVVSYREKNNVTRKDFMQLLIDIKNNKGEQNGVGGDGTTLTIEELAAQSFVFFLAGFETSSTTMTFALYELATHPELQEKVREEIRTVLKRHDNKVTYDSLIELKYMKQVIDETLRKYPPVPFVTRVCGRDYNIPGTDLIVEKGTMVIIPIDGIHWDEEYYPNPEEFDPERFSEENKKTRHPYTHMPFGEGPRICIGERFGIMQTQVGLTSILKNFRVKLHEKTKTPLKMSPMSFILATEGDVWITFDKI